MSKVKVTVGGVKLDAGTTKNEEIEILREISRQFEGKQMYLSSLFTRDLLNWCEGRIRDDFPIDLMLEYTETRKGNIDLLDKYNGLEEKGKESIKEIYKQYNFYEGKIGELNKHIKNIENELEVSGKDVEHFMTRFEEGRIREERLTQKVQELKAQLYDYMMKEVKTNE